jgi:hypothetical protein
MATESRKACGMMTELQIFYGQLDDAISRGDDEAGRMALRRFARARSKQVKPRPKMHTFNMPRESLMTLRDRHLHMVEEYGFGPDYNRDELRTYFLANWNRLFGTLRKSKALEVESDRLRKDLMIEQLLELIEMRRAEYADERAKYPPRKIQPIRSGHRRK